jgi:Asp-tRNA(Asn)/Glu-tRNA(Gln) amidotransferase B subunit
MRIWRKGQLRCDCNVSVRPEAQQEFGAKIEIKNMNSISGVRRALSCEIKRQIAALDREKSFNRKRAVGMTQLVKLFSCAQGIRA